MGNKIVFLKFKKNDLIDDSGKQFEFPKSIYNDFFGLKLKTETLKFIYSDCGVNPNLDNETIEVVLEKSEQRTDYKIYSNGEGHSILKKFLLEKLRLTEENIYDYYALKKIDGKKYNFYYFPKSTTLDIITSKLTIDKEEIKFFTDNKLDKDFNRIIFGAPGTGKSFQLKEDQEKYFDESHFERVTFHPNYSYAQFVGTYKPTMKKDANTGKEEITYEYIPGPFILVLEKALKNPNENYLLLIEEINRANVAAVFGDVFQLLDRDTEGNSEYEIDASNDLEKYLNDNGITLENHKLKIPNNMYIWATMNSADQGVMPLDAAFKRRWNFEYLNIDANENGVKNIDIPNTKNDDNYNFVKWNLFRKALNAKLKIAPSLNVNEDKLLGPFFISLKDLKNAKAEPEKFIDLFKSKVLMYLFEDVCKMNPKALFKGINIDGRIHYSDVCEQFDEKGVGIFGFDAEELNKTEQ